MAFLESRKILIMIDNKKLRIQQYGSISITRSTFSLAESINSPSTTYLSLIVAAAAATFYEDRGVVVIW